MTTSRNSIDYWTISRPNGRPRDRFSLTPEESALAETAAFLKGAAPSKADPDDRFVARLAEQLAARQATPLPSAGPTAQNEEPGHKRGDGPARPAGVSRRALIGRAAAAAAGIAAGAGAGQVLRGRTDDAAAAAAYDRGRADGYHEATTKPYSVPMAPADRGHWMDTGQAAQSLLLGQAARFRAGAIEGFLVNPGGGKPIYALSASCTHMGCMISWLDSTSTFLCPCHGAQYQADGAVLSGIARHPLPRLNVRVDAHGMVQVWSVAEDTPVTSILPYQEP